MSDKQKRPKWSGYRKDQIKHFVVEDQVMSEEDFIELKLTRLQAKLVLEALIIKREMLGKKVASLNAEVTRLRAKCRKNAHNGGK